MDNIELQNIWTSQDQKLDALLSINKEIAINLTRQKLNKQIGRLYPPKWAAIVLGIPYTTLLIIITVLTSISQAYIMALAFGTISVIMVSMLLQYFYQLHLINKVRNDEAVLSTQHYLSQLKISSFKTLNWAILQIPIWSVCWISTSALKESPIIYGGVHLLIFSCLSYFTYWLYQKLSYKNKESKIRNFFLSGSEWDPILKSSDLLDQINDYKS